MTLKELLASRRAHRTRAQRREAQADHHQALADGFKRLEDKQRRMAHKRHEQIRDARAPKGPAAALAEAGKYIGKTEQPAGSNMAPWGLSAWIKHFLGLNYGVPWCGLFVGHCLETAGVAVTGRVAAVSYIYADAKAGANGFEKLVPITAGQPGDAVGLFGISTHVAMVKKRVPGGYLTREGNTSFSQSGSQSNGGACAERIRPYSDVVYVARPRWS